jgi:MSHA pilin protein MshC
MKKLNGFTLVEIIMVIILIGVLGIIGTAGLGSAVSSDRGMYERQLQSAIRYAQNYAMSRFTYTAVVFSAAGSNPSCALGSGNANTGYSGYAVCACNGAPVNPSLQPLQNPLAQTSYNFYVSMNYGINYNVSGISVNYIAFNSAGEPGTFYNNANPCAPPPPPGFTAYNPNTPPPVSSISLSFGASAPQLTFYVYSETGLVSYNGSL